MNWWNKLRIGHVEEALAEIRDVYDREGGLRRLIQLCTVYLWLHEWELAWDSFEEFIQSSRHKHDSVFQRAGLARWCAGQDENAISTWKRGLVCQYTDDAGGLRVPLMLYFASVIRNDEVLRDEAIQAIQKRLAGPRGSKSPSHLARLVLGQTSKQEACLAGQRPGFTENVNAMVKWDTEFWDGVLKFDHGNHSQFMYAMSMIADVSWSDFDSNHELFFMKVRDPVYYLARYELEKEATTGGRP